MWILFKTFTKGIAVVKLAARPLEVKITWPTLI